ncbi:MerR family transcriptional regulator [Galbitalea soli]|uniref:MerR family transcriptional regulator n=1 Tax=Galbitalea soli TaxID=1268042 RepID=A0A7C9PP76_9MICO|nr:TipAS antibiotic-recognition domain-containing protein [Galbitalea soli]NEM91928.1 MerR family transcriptional regulator [Galbitalea soli]NYJ29235.1 DNA-binding transcriptional MerR regulator [Galbitalea soli]
MTPNRPRDWSIQEIARLTGTTSRTLRHYGEIGLLPATRTGAGGIRFYDAGALTRLQRILLLRQLGLGLSTIAEVLAGEADDGAALRTHLELLRREQERIGRQIASVETTIQALDDKEDIMADAMFDGFDHTRHETEVTERWGADAYAKGDRWWRAMTADDRRAFTEEHRAIARDYAAARARGVDPTDPEVRAVVLRHIAWLDRTAEITGGRVTAARLRGLGDMYAGDPRFAVGYGGAAGADYVRAALRAVADELP